MVCAQRTPQTTQGPLAGGATETPGPTHSGPQTAGGAVEAEEREVVFSQPPSRPMSTVWNIMQFALP
ncbi:unnamed protein product [Gadus morhua 'NCC']